MASRLIINADDFGLTRGVNHAIAELHQANALTSATLMATGAAFEDAVRVAMENPGLGVGCHVVLTDGIPVSDPKSIPTLMGEDGRSFRSSLVDFVRALLLGKVRAEEIELEATAQIERLQRAGIRVTHVDTHKHTHLFPAVARPLLRVAERMSVRAVRNPFEQEWSLSLGHGSWVRRFQVGLLGGLKRRFEEHPQIRSGSMFTTDGTIGVSATGDLNALTLAEILKALPEEGSFELCCHPGYNDGDLDRVVTRLRTHRDVERMALLQEIPRLLVRPNAPRLIHYGELAAGQTHETTFNDSRI